MAIEGGKTRKCRDLSVMIVDGHQYFRLGDAVDGRNGTAAYIEMAYVMRWVGLRCFIPFPINLQHLIWPVVNME